MPEQHAPKGPIKRRSIATDRQNPNVPGGFVAKRVRNYVSPPLPPDKAHFDPKLCRAFTKRGHQQCRRPPILGGHVCYLHGGRAPQVAKKAMERLMEHQPRAIGRMVELMEQDQFPSTAYQAARDILDRTMGKPAETVEMNVNASHDIGAILKQRMERRRALTSGH